MLMRNSCVQVISATFRISFFDVEMWMAPKLF